MAKNRITEGAIEVFIDVMQNMAFMDTVPASSELKSFDGTRAYRLPILMPCIGDVIVVFPEIVGDRIYQNVSSGAGLSLSFDDTLGELLNVFAGRIFNQIAPNLLFELGLPVKVDISTISTKNLERIDFKTPCDSRIVLYHPYLKLSLK